jgi:hypothetical protein
MPLLNVAAAAAAAARLRAAGAVAPAPVYRPPAAPLAKSNNVAPVYVAPPPSRAPVYRAPAPVYVAPRAAAPPGRAPSRVPNLVVAKPVGSGAIGMPMGTSYPAQNPVQRMLMASSLSKQMGSGAIGMPMGTSYPTVQRQQMDPELANGIHMMLQRANQDIEPKSSEHLRYMAQRLIREVYPDMTIDGMSDQELLAMMRLAGEQDFAYRTPPPRERDRTQERNSSAFFGAPGSGMRKSPGDPFDPGDPEGTYNPDLPMIYNLGPEDLALQDRIPDSRRSRERNSSAFFGGGLTAAQIRALDPSKPTQERNSSQYFADPDEVERQTTAREQQQLDQLNGQITAVERALGIGTNQAPPGGDIAVDLYARLADLKRRRQELADTHNERVDQPNVLESIRNIGPEDLKDLPGTDSVTETRVWQALARSPLVQNPVSQAVLNRAERLGDAVRAGGMRVAKPTAETFGNVMEWYSQEIQDPIKTSTTELIYQYALSDPEQSELDLNDFGTGLSFLFAIPVMAMIEIDDLAGDGSLRRDIITAYQSDGGNDAAWEVIIGAANDAPWPVKYAWIIAGETMTDPASVLPGVGWGGRVTKSAGQALSALPDASRAERLAGATLRGTGNVLEHGSTAIDTFGVEPLVRGIGRGTRGMGLFDQSIATQVNEADRTVRDAFGNTIRTLDQTADERAAEQAAAQADEVADAGTIIDVQGRPIPTNGATPTARPVDPTPSPNGAGLVDAQGNPLDSAAAKPNGATLADANGNPIDTPTGKPTNGKPPETAASLARRTDPETGQVFPAASSVPDTMPALRAAVTDAPRARGAARAAGESLTRPVPGGTRTQDAVLDRGIAAIEAGDMVTAQKANDFLAEFEAASKGTIGNDPKFVAYGETTTSGQGVGRAFSVPDRVLSQADRSVLGSGKAAYGRLNGLLKQSYELSREELNNAIVGARLWTKYFPGSELPTSADSLFRTADDLTWMQERYPWLAAEFVRTSDVDRARRIWAILNDPNRTDFLAVDAEGKSYLTAIPRDVVARAGDDISIRDLNHQMLREARNAYQTARLQPQQADVASQLGGGLNPQGRA